MRGDGGEELFNSILTTSCKDISFCNASLRSFFAFILPLCGFIHITWWSLCEEGSEAKLFSNNCLNRTISSRTFKINSPAKCVLCVLLLPSAHTCTGTQTHTFKQLLKNVKRSFGRKPWSLSLKVLGLCNYVFETAEDNSVPSFHLSLYLQMCLNHFHVLMLHMPSSHPLVLQLQLDQHCHTVLSIFSICRRQLYPHMPQAFKKKLWTTPSGIWCLVLGGSSVQGQELDDPGESFLIQDIL